MSIFGSIMSAIFGHASAAPSVPGSASGEAPVSRGATAGTAAGPSPGAASTTAASAPGASTSPASGAAPKSQVDVSAVLTSLAAKHKEKLDWRKSIVDLMKLLDLDSSLTARQELAKELHYSGDMHDSAKMNIWLHKQVMQKLADNGGKVPDDLKN